MHTPLVASIIDAEVLHPATATNHLVLASGHAFLSDRHLAQCQPCMFVAASAILIASSLHPTATLACFLASLVVQPALVVAG